MSKNCSSDQEKCLKFEAEGREFAKNLRSLEQFIRNSESLVKFLKLNTILTYSWIYYNSKD